MASRPLASRRGRSPAREERRRDRNRDGDRVRGLAGYDEPFRADAIRGFEFTPSVVPRPGGA